MLETVKYLSDLNPPLDGIKLQNLQILKGTKMYEDLKVTQNISAEVSQTDRAKEIQNNCKESNHIDKSDIDNYKLSNNEENDNLI